MISHLYKTDSLLGLYDPIVYLSDFWVLMRDLILVDLESLERIKKVKAGETQVGDEKLTEKEVANLNYAGKLYLTWDNFSTTYLSY